MASLSGTLATMGPGVPYAIAAKFAHPHRPVFALVGDGAMQMNGINELITIAKYRDRWRDQRLIVLVLNNRDLNQVTWEQRAMEGDPKFEGSQDLPDFPYARLRRDARAQGDPRRLARTRSARGGIEALAADRPVVLRGGHRPRGAAAAAAHHARAGQGAELGAARRRPRTPARSSGSRSSRRCRSSCRADERASRRLARGGQRRRDRDGSRWVARTRFRPTRPRPTARSPWDSTTIVVVHAHAGGERGSATRTPTSRRRS